MLCVENRTSFVALELRQLILFEVGHEVALIFSHTYLGSEVGDTEEFQKLEEVRLVGELLFC